MNSRYPQRIVCLTEEPTEVLYALGEQDRIVGISGFTVRPAQARRDKPKVSAFTSAKIDRILALRPDLAVGFSDIQAEIAQALIKAGIEVWISNHRSVEGILGYVRRLGALVGAAEPAQRYALELERHVEEIRRRSAVLSHHPRVYFEEWDNPMITGILWVSELIGIAGGDDIFPAPPRSKAGRLFLQMTQNLSVLTPAVAPSILQTTSRIVPNLAICGRQCGFQGWVQKWVDNRK